MKILIEESVLRQALEALELAMYQQVKQKSAITALRTALDAAEKVEPVAFVTDSGYGAVLTSNHGLDDGTPLYAHPTIK